MNAKDELLKIVSKLGLKIEKAKIACNLKTEFDDSGNWYYSFEKLLELKKDYSGFELEMFLSDLDFNYDNGFGSQYLFGFVWFDEGSWLERYEYDGYERWDYKKTPNWDALLYREEPEE